MRLVALEDPTIQRYWPSLKQRPPLLYVRGDFTPTDEWAIAVVGHTLAYQLRQRGNSPYCGHTGAAGGYHH
ncbi:MAG: hypothetical protein HC893_02530, partial [Chloroflexaceae bacterium]|nr:hypothetical protein [Chloroflexaceae bacterium]